MQQDLLTSTPQTAPALMVGCQLEDVWACNGVPIQGRWLFAFQTVRILDRARALDRESNQNTRGDYGFMAGFLLVYRWLPIGL